MPARETSAATYVLVDAENLDWAVSDIVGRKPDPTERVQFDRLMQYCEARFPKPVRALIVINSKGDQIPDSMLGFVKALRAAGCEVVPVYGRPDQKVVDLAITRLLGAIQERPASIVLASHDGGDFAEALKPLLGNAGRTVAVLGFREYFSYRFRELQQHGLLLLDLERDANVFVRRLPRLVPTRIDDFDPTAFL